VCVPPLVLLILAIRSFNSPNANVSCIFAAVEFPLAKDSLA
jgi:hypothetical protein